MLQIVKSKRPTPADGMSHERESGNLDNPLAGVTPSVNGKGYTFGRASSSRMTRHPIVDSLKATVRWGVAQADMQQRFKILGVKVDAPIHAAKHGKFAAIFIKQWSRPICRPWAAQCYRGRIVGSPGGASSW